MTALLDHLSTEQHAEQLVEHLRGLGRVAVALSGGVDSAVLAKGAVLACGDEAVAVTAVSPSLATGELEVARKLTAAIGIRHVVINTEEFTVSGYQQNAGDRCYFCKTELYERMEQIIPQLGVDVLCNGANLDDLGDHRPGMRAAAEHQVQSPLLELKLTKANVRALAKLWSLEVWDKPAMPCLSSRIAYGVEVTPERVRRVDLAETFLRQTFALSELRVRCESHDLARIEVPVAEIETLLVQSARERIIQQLKEYGFQFVTIDLEGFRSGSLNRVLNFVELGLDSRTRQAD